MKTNVLTLEDIFTLQEEQKRGPSLQDMIRKIDSCIEESIMFDDVASYKTFNAIKAILQKQADAERACQDSEYYQLLDANRCYSAIK